MYWIHDSHAGRESRDIRNPAKSFRKSIFTIIIHVNFMVELTRDIMKGRVINAFASSTFLTPALMKNARDTAAIFTSITISQ